MTDQDTVAQRLGSLLEMERNALLEGDFDQIAVLLEEKETLIGALEEDPVQVDQLAPLHLGLRRNQELFDQALAGIRNVAARLGDLNRVRRSMNTYDAQGRSRTIEATGAIRMEKRA